uniref:NADH dehydrogenase subunit 3 n=1 Tax=Onukigallia onukii TaxID=1792642 RepID=UPI003003634E|nr:NADH dehydrogenase subunit 3 [Onukigallia onukii]
MNLIMIYFMILMLLTVIMTTVISLISKKSMIDLQKLTPFECGFNPMSNKRLPFSIHFFLIAVIFLIFDIEIIIIMPMIMSMKFTIIKMWLLSSLILIVILLMGLYNEWYQGMLNWSK